jgi:hypothetical protein
VCRAICNLARRSVSLAWLSLLDVLAGSKEGDARVGFNFRSLRSEICGCVV